MARMISRQAAAELLDCNPQTITNWVEKGVIKGHTIGNHLMIDSKSIEQYFDSLKDLSDMEQKMADTKSKLQDAIKDMEAIIDEARGVSFPIGRIRECFRNNQLTLISLFEDCLNNRERSILTSLIKGESPEDIGRTYGLSSERIVQIGWRASRNISVSADLKHIKEENKELTKVNELLRQQNSDLRKRINEYEKVDKEKESNLSSSIFKKRLIDLNLTVRTLNVLKMHNCETLGDVVKFNKSDLINARNFGKKSFTELDDFITKLGLHWGMNPDKMSAEELQPW